VIALAQGKQGGHPQPELVDGFTKIEWPADDLEPVADRQPSLLLRIASIVTSCRKHIEFGCSRIADTRTNRASESPGHDCSGFARS
jgi:hypothetical protein